MNTVEFSQRLLRPLTIKDLALLPADDSVHLLDTTNSAIQRFYALAPDSFKKTTLTGIVTAAKTITLFATNGSLFFSGYTILPEERGATIRIQGDPIDNEITSSNTLIYPFTGTTGTVQATLWRDSIHVNGIIEKMISDPQLETGQWLRKDDQMDRHRIGLPKQVGRPRAFRIDEVGQSYGGIPPALLRVDRLPDRDYRLSLVARLNPRKLRFDELITPTLLPANDSHIESIILPLAIGGLTNSHLWQDKEGKADALKREADAEERARRLSPSVGPTQNGIYTPRGF